MKQTYLIKFFAFICILSMLGCSPMVKKGYQGSKLPDDKIAKILILPNIRLISLDGNIIPMFGYITKQNTITL